jgi:hypothetical protein
VQRCRSAEVLIVADVQPNNDCTGDCAGAEQVQRSWGGGAEVLMR